ncbi:ABC transporter permease [Paenibacillus sp. sgz302251]|uniref:ABC transporter permease n=1 Tax=Paenibacillus sp. sgz302251 TaxID=3414493 RepID=UPI003C7AFA08
MSSSTTGIGRSDFKGHAGTSGLTRFFVMVQKEALELIRSFKLLWVSLVFVLLGVMQPISMHFMPLLLEKAGNMPEGTVIDIPKPLGEEVLAQTLQQFGTLGILILVLVAMGTVSGERSSGAASMILVKPISVLTYIGSKLTTLLLFTFISLSAGYLASWYYTGLLFGGVSFDKVLGSLLVYGLWLSFVMTLTVFFSTLLRSAAAAAFSTLGASVLLSVLAGIFPKQLGWSPGALSGFAYRVVTSGPLHDSRFVWAIVSALILIAAALSASIWLLKRSPAVD